MGFILRRAGAWYGVKRELPTTVKLALMSMAVIHVARMEVMEMVCRLVISAVGWETAVIAIARVKGVIDIPVKAA
jgi:hypothetical protein